VRAKFAGSSSRIHATLEAVKLAAMGHPPNASLALIDAACGADSVSHQSFAGRTTAPAASSATMPCCCPETATETIEEASAFASRRACFRVSRMPSIHVSGSCSAAFGREGWGRRSYA